MPSGCPCHGRAFQRHQRSDPRRARCCPGPAGAAPPSSSTSRRSSARGSRCDRPRYTRGLPWPAVGSEGALSSPTGCASRSLRCSPGGARRGPARTWPRSGPGCLRPRAGGRESNARHATTSAAFLDNVASSSPAARHLHYGMTLSDILDTTLALQLVEAADLLLAGDRGGPDVSVHLARALRGRRRGDGADWSGARTHPTPSDELRPSSGGLGLRAGAGRVRMQRAEESVAVGKASAPSATTASSPPRSKPTSAASRPWRPIPCPRSCLPGRHASSRRDGHGCGVDRTIFTEIRHLARTEVREVEEPFRRRARRAPRRCRTAQPVALERLCAWSRGAGRHRPGPRERRPLARAGHSHSSVER